MSQISNLGWKAMERMLLQQEEIDALRRVISELTGAISQHRESVDATAIRKADEILWGLLDDIRESTQIGGKQHNGPLPGEGGEEVTG